MLRLICGARFRLIEVRIMFNHLSWENFSLLSSSWLRLIKTTDHRWFAHPASCTFTINSKEDYQFHWYYLFRLQFNVEIMILTQVINILLPTLAINQVKENICSFTWDRWCYHLTTKWGIYSIAFKKQKINSHLICSCWQYAPSIQINIRLWRHC